MDNESLIEKIKKGDEASYIWIYNKYVNSLFSYGISLGFDSETVKDAVQDVFLKILYKTKVTHGIKDLKFYLFRSLKNRLLDIYKKETRLDNIENIEFDFTIKVTILDDLIEKEDSLILRHKIECLLKCLTSHQREAIILRFVHEMEYDEIANLLNLSIKSTRGLVFRALERMREHKLTLSVFVCFC